ncbi:TFIIH complex serine/threonine-protein kinase subunit KIN28 [Aspergillus homomorphus CBS 101889]|uniref:Putative serine/threonine protein kinase n=1 Tax=Aspergillus homomorphus (strain CBS 101889) TaxID=1450537 RepID=A0A395I711_ASPHC|nr:putative serine/threonine protein kinase [Aspergillus homomorphus CBS 101889]RAL15686.1 putative serine/threonine protein kinase [Aspergillus homomorphus CBS 101889]
MAVSPLIPPPPHEAKVTDTPKKTEVNSTERLLHNQNTIPFFHSTNEREVTEQLNDDVRHKYIKDKRLGEGTYAVVFLGHLRTDPSSFVAIKKIKVNAEYKDGLSMDAIREVKYLQELSHPNIIALHDVFSSKDQNLNLVLEYLPRGDLEMLIKDTDIHYGAADVKAWMGMLARGVWFCHENFVLHRDIKPNNLLIAADGEVKLADFGLARSFADPYLNMTHQVITRWYRPPELLFGARQYSGVVDVWSMGMVFAELLLRVPFIVGNTDLDQIAKICEAFGTPTEDNWPGVTRLPNYLPADANHTLPVQGRDFFLRQFPTAGPVGADLLMSMCTLDPKKRSTACQVLQHGWWSSEPKPTDKKNLPRKTDGIKKMGADLTRRGGDFDDNTTFKNAARQLKFTVARD